MKRLFLVAMLLSEKAKKPIFPLGRPAVKTSRHALLIKANSEEEAREKALSELPDSRVVDVQDVSDFAIKYASEVLG